MTRNELLEWASREMPTALGLRAMPIEPSGGRSEDAGTLTTRQRWAAARSSLICTALAQLSTHDRFVLACCYYHAPGTSWHVADPSRGWVAHECGAEQAVVDEHKRAAEHERTMARAATKEARQTRAGVDSALARAAVRMAAEQRAKARQTEAEILLRRASLRAIAEAELAQQRFERAVADVVAANSDLAAYVSGRRVEALKLDAAKPRRRQTPRQRLLQKVGEWVLALMSRRAE